MQPPRRLGLVSPEEARAFLKRTPGLDTWLVDAHGKYPIKRRKFTVPRDTAIVYLTMPGCPLRINGFAHKARYASNQVMRGDLSMGALGSYATMYVPGDVIDDMFLDFEDDFEDEEINSLGIEHVPAGRLAVRNSAKFVSDRCSFLSGLVYTHGAGVYILAVCRTGNYSPQKFASMRALNLLARERFRPTTTSPTIRFAELVRPNIDPHRLGNLGRNLSFPTRKTGRAARQAVRVAHVPKPRGMGVVALAKRVLGGVFQAARAVSRPSNAALRKDFDTPDAAAALRRYILRKSKAYGQKEHNRINRAFAARHPNVARESNIDYSSNVRHYMRYKSRKAIDPDTFLYNGTNFWYDARNDLNTNGALNNAKAAPNRRRKKKAQKAQSFNAAAAAYYRTGRRASTRRPSARS